MANPLLLDIARFFAANSVVQGSGIDTFLDFAPPEPDNLVYLMEYEGDPAIPWDKHVHRSVQITTRAKSAEYARLWSRDLFKTLQNAMDEDRRVQFTSTRFGQVYLRQPPFRMQMDENTRTYFTFNVGITTTIE